MAALDEDRTVPLAAAVSNGSDARLLFEKAALRINEWQSDVLHRAARWQNWIQLIAVIAIAFAGIGEWLSNSSGSFKVFGPSIWSIGIVTAFLSSAILLLFTDNSYKIISDAQIAITNARCIESKYRSMVIECENAIDEASGEIDFLEKLYMLSTALRETIEWALITPIRSRDNNISTIEAWLDLLVADKQTLLGFGDERWNFQVFFCGCRW